MPKCFGYKEIYEDDGVVSRDYYTEDVENPQDCKHDDCDPV